MKILISTLFLISYTFYKTQTLISLYGPGFIPSNNSIIGSKKNDKLTYDEIEGSAYYDKKFTLASVSPSYENVPVRYNMYNDQIEFKKNEEVMVLPKTDTFTRISFKNSKDILVLLDINREDSGYFFEIVKGKYSLYKKLKTKFIDLIPAPTSYQTDQPAKFKNLAPVYYIQTDNNNFVNISKLKKEKELLNVLPSKKDALAIFFKDNNIKFDKETDLIKLITFLNQ